TAARAEGRGESGAISMSNRRRRTSGETGETLELDAKEVGKPLSGLGRAGAGAGAGAGARAEERRRASRRGAAAMAGSCAAAIRAIMRSTPSNAREIAARFRGSNRSAPVLSL